MILKSDGGIPPPPAAPAPEPPAADAQVDVKSRAAAWSAWASEHQECKSPHEHERSEHQECKSPHEHSEHQECKSPH